MHTSPPLYARGPYRVVACIADEPGRRFRVIDADGSWLRDDDSLPAACDWVDARIATLQVDGSGRAHARRGLR